MNFSQVPVVIPKENFRLLITMDPRHGELSPAMRNRGVEVYLPEPPKIIETQSDKSSSALTNIQDSLQIPVEELAFYSHATIIIKQFELMKSFLQVNLLHFISSQITRCFDTAGVLI